MEPLSTRDYFQIKRRGEAPSRVSAAQIRDDYKTLLGEVTRQSGERASVRQLLARLALGEVTVDNVVEQLALGPEVQRAAEAKAWLAAKPDYDEPWFVDEPDYDDEIEDCTCVEFCDEDPKSACSLSGRPHVHPASQGPGFGPCPVHPERPGDH